ncbi:hypothetical protein CTI12_AA471590 [Artemisia annua]|uniref:Nucleic acid-binding, OB-fold protein n=1 Tax=Artemisia annua TaxID=35608 RepID=A0A2U1LNJ4_ARTAN|nr:hypothetical protein CTI12_AA471590 [Artemisia annua]
MKEKRKAVSNSGATDILAEGPNQPVDHGLRAVEDSHLLDENEFRRGPNEVAQMVGTGDAGTSAQVLATSIGQVASSTVPSLLPSNPGDPLHAIQLGASAFAVPPVQVTTVDGLASTFTAANVILNASSDNQHSVVETHIQGALPVGPIVLDFSSPSDVHARLSQAAPVASRARRPRRVRAPSIRRPSDAWAPTDYKYFGRCDQLCQHCYAKFWLEEKRTGLPLFRTARDKLLEADIPNFQIRLFGVVGSNQYELPVADSIGAIVYEGGPECMTDYDIVIERHSREPESVNKLHPQYIEMALTSDADTVSKAVAHPPVLQRSLAYFADLKPTENNKFIEARVYRKWTAVKVPSLIATGFSCILLDKKRVLFTQEVMILQIDTAHDWYYQKCDECGGKLDYGYVHGHCHPYGTQTNPQNSYSFRVVMTDGTGNAIMTCFSPQTDGLIKDINSLLQEVSDKNPATTPPQILALQNTRHIFQFRFAKPTTKGRPTFVLQKVMDHPPLLLAPATEGPSSAPTTPPDSLAHSQISPPPTTPATTQKMTTDTSTETRSPSTSAVRKELFKYTADEETYTDIASGADTLTVTSQPTQLSNTEKKASEAPNPPATSGIRKDGMKDNEGDKNDPETKKQKLE